MAESGVQRLAELIDGSGNIVFFGGAGVSTESGIPDFRSETGLYNARTKYGCSPEELISRSFFVKNPEIFYEYYKENLIFRDARPNKAHLALAELEGTGKLKAVVTQNIDGLHQLAGSKTVHELHGSVLRNVCMKCGARYDLDYIMEPSHCVDKDGVEGSVPWCAVCGGMVKPDVVLYEESLDVRVMDAAEAAIRKADMLLVGGTSLVVYPAAGFLNYFKGSHLVLINKSKTAYDSMAELIINDAIGETLGRVMEVLRHEGEGARQG
ncbi:MAG: NAD-dependent protein deacylase [Clostridiales Family XIII bacterium]|nr:NAD-dependent protein deacylase [Clostridiales Family XIII bacterium]